MTIIFVVVTTILVALLIWDAASSNAQNSERAQRYATEYAESAQLRISENCTVLDGSAEADCIRQIVEATHEQQRAEGDLAAQRDMAKWALIMVIVSTFGTLVGVAGLVFIANTLEATRHSNRIAVKSAERQLRAYIQVELGPVMVLNASAASIKMNYQNVGQTPAKFVTVRSFLQVVDIPMNGPSEAVALQKLEAIERATDEMTIGPTIVFSHMQESAELTDAMKEALAAAAAGTKQVILCGKVFYEDVFNVPRTTWFFHRHLLKGGKWEGIYHNKGNHAD